MKKYFKDPRYWVTEDGQVIGQKGKPLIGGYSKGYRLVFVTDRMEKVSRIVAMTYVHNPKPTEYNVVNHINGIKSDDRACNLEWCNHDQNMKHAQRSGFFKHGTNHYLSKLDNVQVMVIKHCLECGISPRVISKYFKVHRKTIDPIRDRRTWKHVVNLKRIAA